MIWIRYRTDNRRALDRSEPSFTIPPGDGEADVQIAAAPLPGPVGRCRLTADLAALELDPALVPAPLTDGDRFDAERWIKATNLYWLDVVTQLVVGLNQVRVNPTQAYAAATAPTVAEVKAGVVAKYQALG